ncbi:RNA-guided endonuclease InsQ/TnpB family protein [Microcoleus sp.]|uniref:RNA-guided endonuclease InsQ/TnpB family protein n=1 Tax=Microcoleus sp. TaxID=44472 RepID=UPI003524CBFB
MKALGIDHGIDNWLTCVSNSGTSFIIDGKHLKSINQWYNKRVATLMEGKHNGFWSHQLARLTEKRNRQMRDAVNKAARLVVNHCIKHRIGVIVFGWNKRQKDSANMGKKNNQQFVQIPTARLKNRIAQLCEQYGIKFVETEESYTSKASFVDRDFLPTIGEKPDGWKETGRRVKRGLYRTGAKNWYINADCNAAANILRKVETMLGIDLDGVCRGALTAPSRITFW